MIAVSNEFKNAMKQPVKELDGYIEINEDNKITSSDDLISFKISCDTGMCKTAMRKLEAKYLGSHNLLGQWVHVGYGVKLANGTFEYLDYGSFLVTEITTTKDTGVTNIVGYDKMVSSMVPYSKLNVEYPINLLDYTKLLCSACGLSLGNEIFGKNLFNGEYIKYAIGGNTGNQFFITNNCRTAIIKCKPNTTYSIYKNGGNRFTVCDYPTYPIQNDQLNRLGNSGTSTIKVTTHADANYLLVYVTNDSTEPILQIEENTHVTSYTPYNQMNDWQINNELWENIDGITYRDILVQIAQVTSSTAIIGNDDKIYFKPINETGESLTYDNMKKWKIEPLYGEINSVVLSRTPQEDNIYMRDDESIEENGLTEWKIENNEIIDKDRDNAMTPIYNAMHGIKYYPFEITTEGLGWYEIADNLDIVNDVGDVFNTSLFNFSITIDGGIKEILKTVADTKTQTQYQYATTIAKRVKNTEIVVNKQEQFIENLVEDMYTENGLVSRNFTSIHQDINNIVNSVQNTGGTNMIKNSVMFAYDTDGNPNEWAVAGEGQLIISSSAEALASGGISGHVFTLLDKKVTQRVNVKVDSDDIPENQKTYYTFSTKIKKDATGTCYVRLFNSNEEHIIQLNAGESSFYGDYELKALLPKDNYYDIEFYGSADSNATFTDNMLNIGDYKSQWSQASGEVMNTQVNINLDGVLIKSSVYLGDYTVMSPLEFAGYSKINGTVTKVFSLNKDTTLVKKLESEDEIKMYPIKIVPVTTGDLQGWAFVPSSREV